MQKNLFSSIREWIKKNRIFDVILFGSSARGKLNPKDIDLCIIINDSDEKKSIELVNSLGRLCDAHITILTLGALISGNTLAKTLFNEGYSIKNSRLLAENIGFKNKSIFIYTLKKFSPSKRVQFHYLLKGRHGAKGILKEAEGSFMGSGSIIVPVSKEDLLKQVFDKWNVDYKIKRALIS